MPEIFYEYIINILFINTLIKYNCTLVIDGEPWFVAKDICDILGIVNPTDALNKGLENFERARFNLGRQGEVNIINESGFYTLVLRSRKSIAKPFRIWVTAEVLPTIRKTGGYVNNLYDMVYSETLCLLYIVYLFDIMVIYLQFVYANRLLRYYFLKNNPPLISLYRIIRMVYIIFNHMPFYSQKAAEVLSFFDKVLDK